MKITVRPQGEANSFALLDDKGQWLATVLANGAMSTAKQEELLTHMADCTNQHEDLLVGVAELRSQLSRLSDLTNPHLNSLDAPTSDSRSPMLYCVYTKQPLIVHEDYEHDRMEWYDPTTDLPVDTRFVRRLELLRKHGRTTFAEDRDWKWVAIKDVETFETAATTKDDCEAYMRAQAPSLREPFIKEMILTSPNQPTAKLAGLQDELARTLARLLAFVTRSSQPGHTGMLNAMERVDAKEHIAQLMAGDPDALSGLVSFVDYLSASLGDPVKEILG